MSKFVEFRKGLTGSKRNTVVDLHTIGSLIDPEVDSYRSLFHFDEAYLKYTQETGSVAGYSGPAACDIIVWDFDSEDLTKCQKDSINLIDRLKKDYDIQESEVGVYFSGKKGFAIELLADGLDYVSVLDQNTPAIVKKLCFSIAKGLDTLDKTLYTLTRIYRIPGTKHNKTSEVLDDAGNSYTLNLYKTQISVDALRNWSMNEIKQYASERTPKLEVKPIANTGKLNMFLYEVVKGINEIASVLDLPVAGPSAMLNIDNVPKGVKVCLWRMSHGEAPAGRDNSLLAVADHYKKQGLPQTVVRQLLGGVLELINQKDPEKARRDPIKQSDLDRITRQAFKSTIDHGCFVADTPITMWDHSYKPIHMIKEGDRVITHTGQTKKVLKTFNNGVKPVFSVKVNGLPEIRGVTANHPIYTKRGFIEVRNLTTEDQVFTPYTRYFRIQYDAIRERLLHRVQELKEFLAPQLQKYPKRTQKYLDKTEADISLVREWLDNYDFMWLAGMWVAEGNLTYYRKGHPCGVALTLSNKYHKGLFNELKRVCKKLFPKQYKLNMHTTRDNIGAFYIHHPLLHILFKYLFGEHSNSKKISNSILGMEHLKFAHFLGGLLDGDGHFGEETVELNMCSEDVIHKIRVLSERFNVYWSYHIRKGKNHRVHSLSIPLHRLGLLAQYSTKIKGTTVAWGGKDNKAVVFDDDGLWRPVMAVTSRGEEEVFNFEVEDDNSYLAGDIAVHNCNHPTLDALCSSKCYLAGLKFKTDSQEIKTLDQAYDQSMEFYRHIQSKIVPTGFYSIDSVAPLYETALGLIVGKPGAGKTSILLNILEYVSRQDIHSIFYNLDMSQALLIQKLAPVVLNKRHGIHITGNEFMLAHSDPNSDISRLYKEELVQMGKNIKIYSEEKIYVKDIANHIDAIEKSSGKKVKFIFVDYVQLLASNKVGVDKENENATLLAKLAKEKDVCVLGLSQASGEGTELRAKGASAWEERARVRMNCTRPFKQVNDDGVMADDYVITLYVGKNSLGPQVSVDMYFDGPTGIVRDLTDTEKLVVKGMRMEQEQNGSK